MLNVIYWYSLSLIPFVMVCTEIDRLNGDLMAHYIDNRYGQGKGTFKTFYLNDTTHITVKHLLSMEMAIFCNLCFQ